MPRSGPPYPPEFRREAVELARVSDKSVPKLAKDLGISDQTLREWIKQADVDAGRREGLSSDERAELRELRKRVRTRPDGSGPAPEGSVFDRRRWSSFQAAPTLRSTGAGSGFSRKSRSRLQTGS
jgi:transposase